MSTTNDPPILQPEFDQPFRFVKAVPRTLKEAHDLIDLLAADVQVIGATLKDQGRMERMAPADYMRWERAAKKAKFIKDQQLRELHLWFKARTPRPGERPDPALVETKRAARQQAHAERVQQFIAASQVNDPRDPRELIFMLRGVILRAMDDGVEFEERDLAILQIGQEYLNYLDGHGALVDAAD